MRATAARRQNGESSQVLKHPDPRLSPGLEQIPTVHLLRPFTSERHPGSSHRLQSEHTRRSAVSSHRNWKTVEYYHRTLGVGGEMYNTCVVYM